MSSFGKYMGNCLDRRTASPCEESHIYFYCDKYICHIYIDIISIYISIFYCDIYVCIHTHTYWETKPCYSSQKEDRKLTIFFIRTEIFLSSNYSVGYGSEQNKIPFCDKRDKILVSDI